jgi:hypothetical protein
MNEVSAKNNTTAAVNRAIAMPVKLTCADGREFPILKWNPSVSMDHAISIDATFMVRLPEPLDTTD